MSVPENGMSQSSRIRQKRIAARISGRMLCPRAAISIGRLSELERGYVKPSDDELQRIEKALDELIAARNKLVKFARSVGFPL